MGLFDFFRHNKIKGPTFLNENKVDDNISILQDLIDRVGDDQKELLEIELKKIKEGIDGENKVIYELKHSTKDMLIIHDVTIEDCFKDSQIDFIIITKKGILVLETKKLVGDIEINSDGEFIRIFKNAQGKVYKKEGIYSPITQNRYHVDALRKLLTDAGLIKQFPIYSFVVIANPKTIVNKIYAKSEIKKQIIKYDQLNKAIDEMFYNSEFDLNDKTLIEIGNYIIDNDTPRKYDYISKYHLILKEEPIKNEIKVIDNVDENDEKNDDTLYENLRKYRLDKSRELNIKPYLIFNNDQLADLVLNKPTNKEEFISINGFADKKYEDYGRDIINIINNGKIDNSQNGIEDTDNLSLYDELKKYRLDKSKELNYKPYFIFNNNQLDILVEKKPLTIDELMNVDGFAETKCKLYGDDIINIIKKHN